MTEEQFELFEKLNAKMDVWIDQEAYDEVEKACNISKEHSDCLINAFMHPTCTAKADRHWTILLGNFNKLPIKEVYIDSESYPCTDSWSYFFFAKLIRAKIQKKGTDCYFRKLDDAICYLERHLPIAVQKKPQTAILCAIYLLEMSASGIGADQRSFAERSQRVLKEYVKGNKYKDLVAFYDLWARYNIGVGYFHDAEYRKAVLEFNNIVFSFIKGKTRLAKYDNALCGRDLLYTPSVLYRADIQLKLQLAYHALKTIGNYVDSVNQYKEAKANLIKAEAYQQMGQKDKARETLNGVYAYAFGKQLKIDDLPSFACHPGTKLSNLKGRLQTLLTAEYLNILKSNTNKTKHNLGKVAIFFESYQSGVALQKPKRVGYFEQIADYLNLLTKAPEQDENTSAYMSYAKKLYMVNKEYLLEEEPVGQSYCPCEEKGIDLRRLSIEHYDQFYKNLLNFYEKVNYPEDKQLFVSRLLKLEEKTRENLYWRKRELKMYKENLSEELCKNWCISCLANSESGIKAFDKVLSCRPCSEEQNKNIINSSRDPLDASDYEWTMKVWDEHFLKHMKDFSMHEPKKRSIHFLGLQRWNSTSPAQGKSLGGGYFVYHTDEAGKVDLGIAVDPGFDFVRNLFRAGFSLADVDVVLLSHAHLDHIRDFESMLFLCLELNKRTDPKIKHKLHAIMTLGVYRQLEHLIENPGLREFVDPYIVDIEKEIEPEFLIKSQPVFTYIPDENYIRNKRKSDTSGSRYKPILDVPENLNCLCLSIVPTKAYHNDFSEYSDSYGFKITIKDGKVNHVIGYTGDTSWQNGIIAQYKDCDSLLIHLGSLIDRQKKFKDYNSKSKECLKLVRDKQHPYLTGMLHFLQEINTWKTNNRTPLIFISEFGEELRGRIRLDFVERLNKACSGSLYILPIDIGLDFLLVTIKSDNNGNNMSTMNHDVYCVQCQRFVPLSKIDFDTYGYDEALFAVCKTCKKSTPQNVLTDSFRQLYEEGKELFPYQDPKDNA